MNILVRHELSYHEITDLPDYCSMECIFILLKTCTTEPIIIGCIYRSHGSDLLKFNEDLVHLNDHLDKFGKSISLVGNWTRRAPLDNLMRPTFLDS